MPLCVVGSSDANLTAHECGALLEDCLVSSRVGLTDEFVEVDGCVIEV